MPQAMELQRAYQPMSLDGCAPAEDGKDGMALAESLGAPDADLEVLVEHKR